MGTSRRITAILVMLIVLICMSGYVLLIPKALVRMGIIKEVEEIKGSEEIEEIEKIVDVQTSKSVWDRVLELKSKIENKFNEVAFRTTFIELNGGIQLFLDKRMIMDANPAHTVCKLENGYLTTILDEPANNLDELVYKVLDLKGYVDSKGMEFVYVNAPFKIRKNDSLLPAGVVDYTNDNADEFLKLLTEHGVECLDLRWEMEEEGIDQYDMFFQTDHHWTPEAGLWAADVIYDRYFKEEQGFQSNLFDAERYDIQMYDDVFLGSLGKRTGIPYAGLDDISIITPKFETDVSLAVPSEHYEKTGDFADVMFRYENMEKDYYNIIAYHVYTGGWAPKMFRNKEGIQKKVLLINDSFGRVFAPFMSLGVSELHSIDIRGIKEYTIYEYIDYYQPDMLFVLYNSDWISSDSTMFDFKDVQ